VTVGRSQNLSSPQKRGASPCNWLTGCCGAQTFGLCIALYFTYPSYAAEPLSDSQMFYMIVGSWTPDPQQLDAIPHSELERYTIEIFHADGTASATIYSDVTCKGIIRSRNFRWGARNGTMISRSTDGVSGSQDDILAIDKKAMTLRLVGGSPREVRQTVGIIEHRVRAINCATPE
jgi:hypothetical protein